MAEDLVGTLRGGCSVFSTVIYCLHNPVIIGLIGSQNTVYSSGSAISTTWYYSALCTVTDMLH